MYTYYSQFSMFLIVILEVFQLVQVRGGDSGLGAER